MKLEENSTIIFITGVLKKEVCFPIQAITVIF